MTVIIKLISASLPSYVATIQGFGRATVQ